MRAALLLLLVFAAQDKKKPEPKDTPRLLYTVPLAAAPGQKAKLVLRGLKLDTVTAIKADAPVKLLSKKKAAGPNNFPPEKAGDSECEIEVELPRDFAAASLELTATGPGGSGTYKLTVAVGTAEKEPNDGFATAQELTLPATVDGTIGRDRDVDVFRFAGRGVLREPDRRPRRRRGDVPVPTGGLEGSQKTLKATASRGLQGRNREEAELGDHSDARGRGCQHDFSPRPEGFPRLDLRLPAASFCRFPRPGSVGQQTWEEMIIGFVEYSEERK